MPDHSETESVGPESPPARPYETLEAGTVVADRYEVRRQLGVGGSSVVYAALDQQLGREIALKVLRTDRLSEKALARCRREVNLARDLRSPHLVSVYDLGRLGDAAWITMELVDGETLRSLASKGPLSIERVIDIGEQVLDGLSALHERGIVHRDVKPGNIMITPAGEVKLADLGLARQWESDESRATSTDGLVGTFEYLSPEQALGLDLDERSDLYSFGVLLYELLTGEIPFRAGSSIGTVVAHLHEKVVDVRARRRDVPAWLAIVITRLLEKKREGRYRDAAEVLRELASRRADWRFALRKGGVKIALAMLAAVVIIGSWLGWRAWSESRFDRLARRGRGNVIALDRKGDILWRRQSVSIDSEKVAAVARLRRWEPMRIVTIFGGRNSSPAQAHTLSILDAQTGSVIRTAALPDWYSAFLGFSNKFIVNGISAVDVDHDGLSEVVVSYSHDGLWPSYAVLYDARSAEARAVFFASGRHWLVETADVDGDGTDELIFAGIANRMGWYSGLAAVRVGGSGGTTGTAPSSAASTPDAEYGGTSKRALVWYALVTSEVDHRLRPRIDADRRRIVIPSAGGRDIVLGFDGFIQGSRSSLAPSARQKAREDAYANLRQGVRMLESGQSGDAVARITSAGNLSREAGDALLTEWITRNEVRALIRLGQTGKAESLIAGLLATAQSPADVAWDAARAYHLSGNPERAAWWYEKGLTMNRDTHRGRRPYEFAEGAVLALVELRRWADATRVVRQYQVANPEEGARYPEDFLAYIEWRSTGRVSRIPPPLPFPKPDLYRYWTLEYEALGTVDDSLLRRIDEAIRQASGNHVLLQSLRADALERLGRHEEAVAEIRNAYREALVEKERDPAVRAQIDVVEKRLKEIARE